MVKGILVLGLGNELLADEGVGVHAARLLQQSQLHAEAKVIAAGTSIIDVLDEVERCACLIVIDAMQGGEKPGTIYRILLDECSGARQIASLHGFDIFRVMALAGRADLPPVVVFGVEPGEIRWSLDLSPAVAVSLPCLIDSVMEEISGSIY